jgi:hypothetical protein
MTNFRRQTLLFVFCFTTFIGISQPKKNTVLFNHDTFYKDTLYIKARFMECGEWGGHLELSRIFLKDNEFHIIHQKYSADCNTIKENNGEPKQTLIKTVNKNMSGHDEQLIRLYLHQLVDAKFREEFPGHAGYIFKTNNTDNTINLRVYTWSTKTRDEYIQLIKQLFP